MVSDTPQKPSQSTQHMWNIWIWFQEQWNWPKNKGISLKPSRTLGETRKTTYFVHLTLSNEVRSNQKPSQSIQHMWIIWIWHQEAWNWPKNKGISLKTILNCRWNKQNHFVCPFTPIIWAQNHSATISVDSAHLKCMDLTLRTMILAKNHEN